MRSHTTRKRLRGGFLGLSNISSWFGSKKADAAPTVTTPSAPVAPAAAPVATPVATPESAESVPSQLKPIITTGGKRSGKKRSGKKRSGKKRKTHKKSKKRRSKKSKKRSSKKRK